MLFFSMLKPFSLTTKAPVPVLLQNPPLHVLPSLCSEILVGYLVNYIQRIWVADEVAGTPPWLKSIPRSELWRAESPDIPRREEQSTLWQLL